MSDGSILVLILKGETKPSDKNIENIKELFSDKYFFVEVCSVDIPEDLIKKHTSASEKQYIENYKMEKVLRYASEGPYLEDDERKLVPQYWWKDLPVIVIKDSSVSDITPEGMKKRIQTSLEKAKNSDIFFLCKWGDLCNKYGDIEGTPYLKQSLKPTAEQAVMYTPKSRDLILKELSSSTVSLGELLNNNISKKKLSAAAFIPNIVNFDINVARSEEDYAKLSECSSTAVAQETSSVAPYVWILIIIAVIIIGAWFLMSIGSI